MFAEAQGHSLDHLGITVCSVAGTNFTPYVKFLAGLGIPFAVITDWDPVGGRTPLGMTRATRLAILAEKTETGKTPQALVDELEQMKENEFAVRDKCEEHGVFTNNNTLEVDLFHEGFADQLLDTLREQSFSKKRKQWIEAWAEDHDALNVDDYLTLIDAVGKGRFAQRLAARIGGMEPPDYIRKAITFVADRV